MYASGVGTVSYTHLESVRRECDIGVKNPSELLDKIETRLDNLQKLRRKYGATTAEILAYRENAEKKLRELTGADELAEDLENELSEIHKQMKEMAAEITEMCIRDRSITKPERRFFLENARKAANTMRSSVKSRPRKAVLSFGAAFSTTSVRTA